MRAAFGRPAFFVNLLWGSGWLRIGCALRLRRSCGRRSAPPFAPAPALPTRLPTDWPAASLRSSAGQFAPRLVQAALTRCGTLPNILKE